MNKFEDFIDYFLGSIKTNRQTFLYISIGSGNNVYQQFPKHILNIKRRYPVELHLILIDPKIKIKLNNNYVLDPFTKGIYHNHTDNIHIYEIPDNFYYNTETFGLLRLLNRYIIQINGLLMFHDFTGRDTWRVAEYFDKELGNYTNKIVYDLSLRDSGNCAFNTNDERYHLAVVAAGDKIKFINPFKFSFRTIIVNYLDNSSNLIKFQIGKVIKRKIDMFFSDIYSIYRRLYALWKKIHNKTIGLGNISDEEVQDIVASFKKDHFSYISGRSGRDVYEDIDLEKTNIYDILYTIKVIMAEELQEILFMIGSPDISKSMINAIYINPYKWEEDIRNYIKKCLSSINAMDVLN